MRTDWRAGWVVKVRAHRGLSSQWWWWRLGMLGWGFDSNTKTRGNNLWLKHSALLTECVQIFGLQTELRQFSILLGGMKRHSQSLAHWYYRQLVHLREKKNRIKYQLFRCVSLQSCHRWSLLRFCFFTSINIPCDISRLVFISCLCAIFIITMYYEKFNWQSFPYLSSACTPFLPNSDLFAFGRHSCQDSAATCVSATELRVAMSTKWERFDTHSKSQFQ